MSNNILSVVIPTYNRAYCLEQTLPTYMEAGGVDEVVIVSDGSSDDTERVVRSVATKYPNVQTVFVQNDKRLGAAASREIGVKASSSRFAMFGEDDVLIDANYPGILLEKVQNGYSIASGRIIYLLPHESIQEASHRFIENQNDAPYLNERLLNCNHNHKFESDTEVAFSHALYMASRDLLLNIGFDPFYRQGAGYREETDTQLIAFLHGHRHLLCVNAFCFHLDFSLAKSGGQRTSRYKQWYWNIVLNNYFLSKNYLATKSKLGLEKSIVLMKYEFFCYQTNVFIIKPLVNNIKLLVYPYIKIIIKYFRKK